MQIEYGGFSCEINNGQFMCFSLLHTFKAIFYRECKSYILSDFSEHILGAARNQNALVRANGSVYVVPTRDTGQRNIRTSVPFLLYGYISILRPFNNWLDSYLLTRVSKTTASSEWLSSHNTCQRYHTIRKMLWNFITLTHP